MFVWLVIPAVCQWICCVSAFRWVMGVVLNFGHHLPGRSAFFACVHPSLAGCSGAKPNRKANAEHTSQSFPFSISLCFPLRIRLAAQLTLGWGLRNLSKQANKQARKLTNKRASRPRYAQAVCLFCLLACLFGQFPQTLSL